MLEYTTTNIRLPKGDLKKLKFVAVRENKSVSAVIRDLVRERIAGVNNKRRRKKIEIWDLPKYAVDTGHRNLASEVDKIVYGA